MRVRFQPYGTIANVEPGTTLLEAATLAGVDIEAICGGRGTCAKCKVIAAEGLSPLSEAEEKHLSAEGKRAGYRLACQAVVLGDVVVVVPEESRISRVSILADGLAMPTELDPWVRRHVVQVSAATLEDQLADLDNVRLAWKAQGGSELPRPSLRALQQLPQALRVDEGQIAAWQVDDEIVRFEGSRATKRTLGMAFDLGTTTIVGYLMDLDTGEQLAVASVLNPQTRYGDDVVSRIDFSVRGDRGLEVLQRAVIGALNEIIALTAARAAINADDILAMTVAGNTTMQHLFLGVSPKALAQSPYVPAVSDAVCLRAEELGLRIYPGAHVWVLPSIAGWVGGDTVGVLLATGIYESKELALAIDIGTNGEMAMGSRERLVTCSTAAGPAFEGAHLSCGMRAADGAIDWVEINDHVKWRAIGGAAPRGVCGSGLVDLVSELLKAGIVNETGMLETAEVVRSNGGYALAERIAQSGRQRAFRLVDADEGASGRALWITQRDVRELQLAKGAIRAGIEILMRELQITRNEVRRVYLAGAFGNYIRPQSALTLGLMPHFPNAEIVPVGNAAGSGAKMALLSRATRDKASELVKWVEYLELSGRPDFQEAFAEAMLF